MIPDHGLQATSGPFSERARAKVNLTLRILGRRPDGYHELESLVAFADEADLLTLDPARPAGLTVTGPMAAILDAGPDNLVSRALARAESALPGLRLGHVTLEKHLPVAAGIGGGSANAAAALRLLRRCNPEPRWSAAPWLEIAAGLGADVPVCLLDRAAIMTGIGERLAPLPVALDVHAVLVNPMVDVPANKTAAVFKALAAPAFDPGALRPALMPPADPIATIEAGANDLERPARQVMPIVGTVLDALSEQAGCRVARLSGAGPTCFGVFAGADAAAAAKNALSWRHATWWIRATRLR